LRAVEEALADLPASRRAELLSELSERIAVRKAELNPEGELAEILELLDDNDLMPAPPAPDDPTPGPASPSASASASAFASASASDDEDPIDIAPGRRVGAIAWVLIVAAAMLVMCLAAVLTFAFFMVRASLH